MSKKLRFLLVLAFLGLAGYLIYPTVTWYFLTPEDMRELAMGTREAIRDYAQEQAVADRDELMDLISDEEAFDGPLPEKYSYLIPIAKKNYKMINEPLPDEWTVRAVCHAFNEGAEVYNEIEIYHKDQILELKALKEKTVQLGLDLYGGMSVVLRTRPLYIEEEEEIVESNRGFIGRTWDSIADWTVDLFTPDEKPVRTFESDIDRALEILNNRIDKLGLVEPQIRKMNDDQILVEIPGPEDPERVRAFLKGKSTLAFHIVDEEATSIIQRYTANGGQIVDFRPAIDGIIAPNLKVLEYTKKDLYGVDQFIGYMVVEAEPVLDGRYIQNATVYTDPTTARPNVSFYVSNERIVKNGVEDTVQSFFGEVTGRNINRMMAIVLDDRIKAAPVIQSRLTSSIRIRGFDAKEANDLALILRTEAMPVELEMESYQVVRATLGKDTIHQGMMAFLIGFIAVMVFMLVYYKGSGIIADIALLLNLILISSILSALNLTLTMTSIAGVILNIGMAVDANVIIFERIKEEIRLGKSRAAAVDAGFKKAFWTVMDANITTFIAAIFLSLVGKGPVQGFAVTLAVGIICSMFTALFVSRLMFDFTTDVLKRQKVSIGWGLYK